MATRLMDDDARYGDGMDGVFPDRAAQFMEGGGLYSGEGIDGLFPDRSAHFVDDPVGDPLGSVFSAGSARPMGGAAPYGTTVDSVFPDRAGRRRHGRSSGGTAMGQRGRRCSYRPSCLGWWGVWSWHFRVLRS